MSAAPAITSIAVENTPQRHNMVVCTLCSCYPWEVLGLPPVWYKSAPYRSRAVKDPRGVLADFGVTLPKDTEIRVWDSTAETRYLVLPMRPAGTEGWSEEQLAELVTRDSMIGTGLPRSRPKDIGKMNGVHDMGGMDGFGTVEPEPNEPVFHARLGRPRHGDGARHGRHTAAWNIDCSALRARDRCRPPDYLSSSYYQNWFAGVRADADANAAWSAPTKSRPAMSLRPKPAAQARQIHARRRRSGSRCAAASRRDDQQRRRCSSRATACARRTSIR